LNKVRVLKTFGKTCWNVIGN